MPAYLSSRLSSLDGDDGDDGDEPALPLIVYGDPGTESEVSTRG